MNESEILKMTGAEFSMYRTLTRALDALEGDVTTCSAEAYVMLLRARNYWLKAKEQYKGWASQFGDRVIEDPHEAAAIGCRVGDTVRGPMTPVFQQRYL